MPRLRELGLGILSLFSGNLRINEGESSLPGSDVLRQDRKISNRVGVATLYRRRWQRRKAVGQKAPAMHPRDEGVPRARLGLCHLAKPHHIAPCLNLPGPKASLRRGKSNQVPHVRPGAMRAVLVRCIENDGVLFELLGITVQVVGVNEDTPILPKCRQQQTEAQSTVVRAWWYW